MDTFKLTEKEIDLIHEALTYYRDEAFSGNYDTVGHSEEDVDALCEKLGYED